jgi:hypothetical protein
VNPVCWYEGCEELAVFTVMPARTHLNGELDTWGQQHVMCCLDHVVAYCLVNGVSVVRSL